MSVDLETVALHITRVCSQKCPYCYVGSENRDTHPHFEQIERIIYELARQKIKEIYFVGGDSCSYPKLKAALKLSHHLGMQNTILSNTLDFGQDLRQVQEHIDCFEATILGSSLKEHDMMSGKKGSYENLVKNILAINREGRQVGIVFNSTPSTFDKLFTATSNLVMNFGIDIKYVMIQRIIPQGRAKGTLKYSLSIPQVHKLFEDIEKIDKKLKLPIVFEDPFPLCIIDKKYHRFSSRCEWGFTKGAVDEKGNVSRCGSDPRYQIGNMFETDLQTLWKDSPILKSFRSYQWLPMRCQKCELLKKCGGGCSLSCITDQDHMIDILYPWKINQELNTIREKNERRHGTKCLSS